jgi:hypothetical protein
MAEDWITLRRDRLLARRVPFPIAVKESTTGGFSYVQDEFLVAADLVGVLAPLLASPDVVAPADRVPAPSSEWLADTDLLAYGYVGDPAELPGLVAQMRATAGSPRVALHYVLSGENKVPTVPRGGPARAPQPIDRVPPAADWGDGAAHADVAILDTGLFRGSQAMRATTPGGAPAVAFRPPGQAGGDDVDELHALAPDGTRLHILGSEAGHGSFIAALVQRMALGGVRLEVHKVLDPEGLGTERHIVEALRTLRTRPGSPPKIINLSLGGFTDDGGWVVDDAELTAAFDGYRDMMPLGLGAELDLWVGDPLSQTVFVCAAGNDGQERPFWPAAGSIDQSVASRAPIVAVGSLDEGLEPSEFSNAGPWVTVSTIGENVASDYPRGPFPIGPGDAVESFPGGGARWSGTSFAAPIIAAEIARRSKGVDGGPPLSGAAAWGQLLDGLEAGPRLPGHGSLWNPAGSPPERYPNQP